MNVKYFYDLNSNKEDKIIKIPLDYVINKITGQYVNKVI
jgi:hypothetical protein